jgi:hypothetical protein
MIRVELVQFFFLAMASFKFSQGSHGRILTHSLTWFRRHLLC